MVTSPKRSVMVEESGEGPYGERVTIGPHVMRADEAHALGGQDAGPSPYEYVMAGLGACTAMTLRMYAARHNLPLQKVSVAVHHKKVASVEGAIMSDRFERIIHLQGELTDAQRARLVEIADRCPVSQTLQHSSEVAASLAEKPLSASAAGAASDGTMRS
jgi:putative redox protein